MMFEKNVKFWLGLIVKLVYSLWCNFREAEYNLEMKSLDFGSPG